MKRYTFVIVLASLIFVVVPVKAQQGDKKPVTEADYDLWGRLVFDQLSDQGKWVSYYMNHEAATDTLFVKSSSDNIEYAFPESQNGRFIGEQYFLYNSRDGIALMDLATGKQRINPGSAEGAVTGNGRYLITYGGLPSNLTVTTIDGKPVMVVPQVKSLAWSNSRNMLLCNYEEAGAGAMAIIEFKGHDVKNTVIASSDQRFTSLTWSPDDSAVAFYGGDKNSMQQLFYYSRKHQELRLLAPELNASFPSGMVVGESFFRTLRISQDGTRIFFGLRNAQKKDYPKQESDVEVWYGNSKRLFPVEHFRGTSGFHYDLGVWSLHNDKVTQITNGDDAYVMIAGKEQYAIVGDTRQYAPNYKYDDDLDLYLVNLKTGAQELIVEKVSEATSQTLLSPDGMYLIFYKGAAWWVYSVATKTFRNLTDALDVSWDKHEHDPGNMLMVYGVAGWVGDKEVLINDQYDIWLINVLTGKANRLTKGRELKQHFRMRPDRKNGFNYSGNYVPTIDHSSDFLLEVYSSEDSSKGYAHFNFKKGVYKTHLNCSEITKVKRAGNVLAYVEERYDLPPQLTVQAEGAPLLVIVKSNTHQQKFKWGTAKLFSFPHKNGTDLRGVLYFPADYDHKKKYPMVVYIYEKLSQNLHNYVNPNLSTGNGFNISNLVAKGYVVMTPDITFDKGAPALSALDCVTSAVRAVIGSEYIDADRIGIYGHSFGGFQVDYIVTKTDLFAAAVSGAGISDLISFSLNMEHGVLGPDIWRVENYQYRMVKSIYEDMQGYLNNSAIYNAATMDTPLLLFAGKADDNVNPQQSVAYYFALRRLKKEVVMLKYPAESHINLKLANTADLTRRIEAWFDYYLKGKPIGWIAKQTN